MEVLVLHLPLQAHLLKEQVVEVVVQTLVRPLLAAQVLVAAATVVEIMAHKLLVLSILAEGVVALALGHQLLVRQAAPVL
jgi:hypothetical protein